MTQDFYIGMVVGSAIATVIWIALGSKRVPARRQSFHIRKSSKWGQLFGNSE